VGAHKHELAFPDTDDDDDDDEVDTTEDMTLLIRVFKCSHRSANTKMKRIETKRNEIAKSTKPLQTHSTSDAAADKSRKLDLQRRFWTRCEKNRFSG